jgi:hypothetical protein
MLSYSLPMCIYRADDEAGDSLRFRVRHHRSVANARCSLGADAPIFRDIYQRGRSNRPPEPAPGSFAGEYLARKALDTKVCEEVLIRDTEAQPVAILR